MRHGKKFNHLGRTASHRKAMLSNMASSLLTHKRISTTLAKAKELRKYVEPFITRAKEDTTHNRRVVFRYLQNKDAIKVLFGEVVEKVGSRPGGYTRIIKTGFRLGDNAEMCIIELVDFNELLTKEDKATKKPGRRRRRGSGKTSSQAETDTSGAEKEKAKETPEPEDAKEATAEADAEKKVEKTKKPSAKAKKEEPSEDGEEKSDKDDNKKSE
ncbi:50S ribosomal protein L17 [Pleomorphovibrio marinus]|uniref:50S ribosomal protein L17 n=1 Tax=Pleomorphovibrio marinus TaxID=2164132 RepID=UPI000E0C8F92|nr:50S ribosomal protein L17 [Pleomorphovibrio marinus]